MRLLFASEIAYRYDADWLTILDNWQTTDGFVAHQPHRFRDGVRGRHRRQLSAANLLEPSSRWVVPIGNSANDDIAVCCDPIYLTVIDDDNGPNIEVTHGDRGVN